MEHGARRIRIGIEIVANGKWGQWSRNNGLGIGIIDNWGRDIMANGLWRQCNRNNGVGILDNRGIGIMK